MVLAADVDRGSSPQQTMCRRETYLGGEQHREVVLACSSVRRLYAMVLAAEEDGSCQRENAMDFAAGGGTSNADHDP